VTERGITLTRLAARIAAIRSPGPLLVGIDGTSGSGKTVFAGALATAVHATGRPIIVGSSDDFHNPRAVRYRQGKSSPHGFFEDSYNYPCLCSQLLDPLRGPAPASYRLKAFDHRLDAPVASPLQIAAPDAILIFEGLFLLRPQLRSYWHFSIVLQVPMAETYRRMSLRDGCPADPQDAQNRRYLLGEQLYLDQAPQLRADVVIDNSDVAHPVLLSAREMDDRPRVRTPP